LDHKRIRPFFALLTLVIASGCDFSEQTPYQRPDAGSRRSDARVGETEVIVGSAIGEDPPTYLSSDGARTGSKTPASPARYVIVLWGDGMGIQQVEAARLLRGTELNVDTLHGPVMCRTISANADPDSQALTITDSAAAATAVATGTPVLNGVLSLNRDGKPLKSVTEIFRERGKSVGLITNSYILDASPMAFAAHVQSRYDYYAIGAQLFAMTRPDVVMGEWMAEFGANDTAMAELAMANGYEIVSSAEKMRALTLPWSVKVLGLFHVEDYVWPASNYGLTPAALRGPDNKEPTLVEMTRFTLDRLSHNPNGFFLFIEDEQIDTLAESGQTYPDLASRLLPTEVVALDDVLGTVLDWIRENGATDDALVVFMADHETGGYELNGDLSQATLSGTSHTLRPVPVFATGPGAAYIDSFSHLIDVFRLLIGTLSPEKTEPPPDADQ
jgi:alkaline phosphatase